MSNSLLADVHNADVNGNSPEADLNGNDLLETGQTGTQDSQLAELGLESIAVLGDIPGMSPTDGDALLQTTSSESVTDESTETGPLRDAYFGSFDEQPAPTTRSAEADEVVIGPDQRIRINNTASYPWRVICSLRITARDGSQWIGTGWFIGPRTVMTAGHCVFLRNRGGWARSITVMPGRNGNSLPYGSCVATSFRSVTGWTNSGNRNSDYGCIILPENCRLGARTGWIGFAYLGDSSLRNKYLNLPGYPGDKPAGTMWYNHRRVKSLTSRTITYEIDTAGGQSGSPVYYIHNGHRYAVGIHTNGSQSGNSATRITSGVYNLMKNWKALGQ